MTQSKSVDRSRSIGEKLVRGAVWMIVMRWSSRLMGLASMVVVARLLSPDDFGIFAITTALIGLFEVFTDIGADLSIIRHPDPQRKHYDTAWTFRLILTTAAALIILAASPLVIEIYADERYQPIMLMMAVSVFVGGLANIGIVDFRKNLEFHKDFNYNFLVQLFGVLATLIGAFFFRSYWALVLGVLVRSFVSVLLSYYMHPYRPKISLAARHELFSFSFWIMIRSVSQYAGATGDRLIIGAFFAEKITGLYAIAGSLATMAVFELLNPIGRALLPGLAAKHGDARWESENLKKIFSVTSSIAMISGVLLSALAAPVIELIYGNGFIDGAPILSILAISAALNGLTQPVGQYFVVLGKTKDLAVLYIFEGMVSLLSAYLMALYGFDIMAISWARVVIMLLGLFRLLYLLRLTKNITGLDIVSAWTRPVVAGVAMYAVLFALGQHFSFWPALYLTLGVPIGFIVYGLVSLLLWRLFGCPAGIEAILINRFYANRVEAG